MALEQRVASVHPALFTSVTVGGSLFFSVFTARAEDPLAYRAVIAVIFFAFVALGFLWLWSIYAVASAKIRATAKWTVAFLLTPLLLAAVKLLLGDDTASSEGIPAMLLRFSSGALFIACVWKTAEAFEIALSGKGVSIGKIGGTAVFLLFSIVGVWTLRERILTLVARLPSAVQEA
ncbi:hypothetical protein [Caulobacter sp. CCH9-E1]|jgi:hypothetical protein|uniref:hypothetical protein n=1 Tax=Caulobacter sp. CCH9-E1 TaxID=1768768 RepID=UPI000829EE87|nr:hypothetical protein [Caulobacter sp. CCH9-E1]